MAPLVRFGVSLDKGLLEKFDDLIKEKSYVNRSEALRDLIREALVAKEWESNRDVTGAITIVYDHHKRELVNHLINVQHEHQPVIVSTQHIHLDHHNCLEVIVFKGNSRQAEELYHKLKSSKGVKHAGITITTTGKELA